MKHRMFESTDNCQVDHALAASFSEIPHANVGNEAEMCFRPKIGGKLYSHWPFTFPAGHIKFGPGSPQQNSSTMPNLESA